MACDEVKSEKYQSRKSPPFHAKDCKDITKKGKDGDYVSKVDARGVYKWVKIGSRMTRKTGKGVKSYLIHDNGGRPFKVEVSGKTVEIYKGEYRKLADGKTIDYDNMDYDRLIKKYTVKDVHVGKSDCIPAADGCGKDFIGNTILLSLPGKKYIHVGRDIYEFTMEDDLDVYYSLVGNNDVPYPILLGSKNVYFMLDYTYLPRDLFKAKMTAADWSDAYQYYYGYKDLDTGEQVKCDQRSPKDRMKCTKERGEKTRAILKKYEEKMKEFKMI